MTSFSHVATTIGAHGAQGLGIEFTPRRGCAATEPKNTPLSKSASIRAIQQFGIHPVSDVNLIPRIRRQSSSPGASQASPRHRDLPETLRRTSIDHQVSRRHSPPPQSLPRTKQNEIVQLARVADSAGLIGRRSPRSKHEKMKSRSSSASSILCATPGVSCCATPGASLPPSAVVPVRRCRSSGSSKESPTRTTSTSSFRSGKASPRSHVAAAVSKYFHEVLQLPSPDSDRSNSPSVQSESVGASSMQASKISLVDSEHDEYVNAEGSTTVHGDASALPVAMAIAEAAQVAADVAARWGPLYRDGVADDGGSSTSCSQGRSRKTSAESNAKSTTRLGRALDLGDVSMKLNGPCSHPPPRVLRKASPRGTPRGSNSSLSKCGSIDEESSYTTTPGDDDSALHVFVSSFDGYGDIRGAARLSKTLGKGMAKFYEQQIQRLVRQAQKKAMRAAD